METIRSVNKNVSSIYVLQGSALPVTEIRWDGKWVHLTMS